jgi:hypothetical protein
LILTLPIPIARKPVEKSVIKDLRSVIQENEVIHQEQLSEGLKNQRPDMVFERRAERQGRRAARAAEAEVEAEAVQEMPRNETRMIAIVEFSCPYGEISHGRDSLIKIYEEKKRKSAELANVLKRVTGKQVRVTTVIVSSMGAVYVPSMNDLQKVLKRNDRKLKKLTKKMLETVIVGSMEIWRQATRDRGAGMNEEVNRLIEEIAVLTEEVGATMEVEQAARAEAGGGAGGEVEMDARMENVGLEEEGFEANVEAGREFEVTEVWRVGRRINVEVEIEVMVNLKLW